MAGNKHSGNLKEIKHLTDQKQNQAIVLTCSSIYCLILCSLEKVSDMVFITVLR